MIASKGFDVIRWVEANCVFTQGEWAGKPFCMLDWQKRLVVELFEIGDEGRRRYRWALWGVPKKQGKTELAAALGLYLLLADGEPSPLVVCAAASDDQADLVFGATRTTCERSPTLSLVTECFDREILVPTMPGARLRRVAAAAGTNDGQNISAVICDELHEWASEKGRNVWNVLTNGTGARRQPLVLQITTAGWDQDSICFEQYTHGKAVASGEVEDPRFHFYWLEAPADADYRDPAVWEAVNPSMGVTVHPEFFADQLTKKPENVFRRYFLNTWTEAEEGWITPAEWDACRGEPAIPSDVPCFVGVDIGRRKDSTAIVAAAMVGDKFHVRALIRVPTSNRPVAVADARADVAQLHDELQVEEVVYDPYLFAESAEILSDRGLTLVEFPQNDSRMAPASEALYELIRAGRVVHDGDPELRSQMLAAVPSQTERGVRISKRKSKKRIDAAVAFAMAADRAMHAEPETEIFCETYG